MSESNALFFFPGFEKNPNLGLRKEEEGERKKRKKKSDHFRVSALISLLLCSRSSPAITEASTCKSGKRT
ncbi:hypothetical protein SLEP1_g5217 [Rubroshorea leprosula]|uniref:Uncharacterized protein n=1 Tax=Rubroshorea leprosula TaxID=152421 RepID=A0AAV5I217_9ROSI|nr:hypothetical protein SLEP1_g5217 [Rubroshorea leprosula]